MWKDYRCSTRDESDDFLFVKLFIVPYRILISTIIFQVLDSKYSMYLSLKCSTFYLPTSKSTLPVDRLRPWPVRKACRLRAFSDSFVAFQLLQVASNELFLFSFLFFFFFFLFLFLSPPLPSFVNFLWWVNRIYYREIEQDVRKYLALAVLAAPSLKNSIARA